MISLCLAIVVQPQTSGIDFANQHILFISIILSSRPSAAIQTLVLYYHKSQQLFGYHPMAWNNHCYHQILVTCATK